MEKEFDRKVALLLDKEPRYASEAYYFVAEAVNFTVSSRKCRGHVSALQLLEGIRKFAGEKFGVAGEAVLNTWGMKTASDAGEVVYLLIGVGLLKASEDDRREDFNTGETIFPKSPVLRCVRRRSDKLPFIDG